MKYMRRICGIMLCFILLLGNVSFINAEENVSQRTVKVGFFSADGYHIMDKEGTMSGYGYDFLQMLLRYNDWKYQYVGYDANWGDMLKMLDSGEIDMVTLANKTPEREAKYDFSDKAIGSSSTIMTIRSDNFTIVPGEKETYNGAIVGLVEGSSHNKAFEEYAATTGFTYQTKYYEDIEDLLSDLKNGKNVDIAVTSNMRVLQDEQVLDEFNANDYYVMVRKGDDELLQEINRGIAQLNVNTSNWQTTLFNKYYDNINESVISFTTDERQYINELKEKNYVIKAAMNPELCPYSYFEDGKAKGIAATLFAQIANNLGIEYEILESSNRQEYKEQLNSGEADVDLTAFLDYSLAQKYNLKETDAYIDSTMSMLFRKDSNLEKTSMTIAVVQNPTEYIGYNNQLIYQYDYKEYDSIQACIDAVKKGEVDATFRYVYIAERAVAEDYTNHLKYTILPEYSFSLAIGVMNERDHRLLSILNKGVNSLTDNYTQSVLLEESGNVSRPTSLLALAYSNPMLVICAGIIVACVLFLFVILLMQSRNQKLKLIATKEMQRFIGYICESYELVVEINLKTNQRIVYKMEDGKLKEIHKEHSMFDKEFFEQIVQPGDVCRMVECFSPETIDQMIENGGTESYIECQVKQNSDDYIWYSYIIKAVSRDAQHPRNFVVFKKNIQDVKETEEQQKQILRDALENAKSASVAKGQFLSRMSHEIRTPLNAVIGYMEIAKDAKQNPKKLMHCVENSDIAAKHLLSIINDVLDISSIESGKMKIAMEEFNLKNQITNLTAIFFQQAKGNGIKFEVIIDEVMQEWIIGDTLRLNQILMNLLSNAMKFTPEGGKVTLKINQLERNEEEVYMTFTVSDTGIGMSEEYQKRLFTPFEQESASTAQKYGGTGLGLSITFNLIQMMGGCIEVHSKQNEGSSFVVSLHFKRSNVEHEEAEIQQDYAKVRALIVDESTESCEYMKALLKRCKVKSDMVQSADAAVKRIKGRMGTEYEYNLCILNWDMSGTDCLEVAKQIQSECRPNIPMIVATAYDVTELDDVAQSAGISKVIAKPLFQSTMFDLLVTMFGKYEPEKKIIKNLEDIRGLHVLLAEDNPMNMEIAIEILQKAGLVVDSAVNGKIAVERFVSQPENTYNAILMDIQMPEMDGYQATAAIRSSNHPQAKSIPIVAMTANAFAEDVNAALASGMNGHISKPVNYDKLYEVLHRFCN